MKAELICTIEQFPKLKDRITFLFNDDEDFQALCQDYFLCVKSLGQWEMSAEKDEKLLQEYKELKQALEKELLQYVGQVGQQHDHDLN